MKNKIISLVIVLMNVIELLYLHNELGGYGSLAWAASVWVAYAFIASCALTLVTIFLTIFIFIKSNTGKNIEILMWILSFLTIIIPIGLYIFNHIPQPL